jgi:hypothetical protein
MKTLEEAKIPAPRLMGRQSVAATNVIRLDSRQHWPAKSNTRRCRVFSARGVKKGNKVQVREM